jgi:hypothetical protein
MLLAGETSSRLARQLGLGQENYLLLKQKDFQISGPAANATMRIPHWRRPFDDAAKSKC